MAPARGRLWRELLVRRQLVEREHLCGHPGLVDPLLPVPPQLRGADDERKPAAPERDLLDEGEPDLGLARAAGVQHDGATSARGLLAQPPASGPPRISSESWCVSAPESPTWLVTRA
jgi:hypothetical protein